MLSLARTQHKPLWFDELGTLDVASQPTLQQMFRVEPGDGNPPLQYLLVRLCLHAFGANAFALRLPALLFVALAIVCLYVFVGRRFGAASGLLAAVLLVFSPLADYGVEARPYGLVLGLMMLLLVLWQRAAEARSKRPGLLAGMTATVFALVITHPTGLFWASIPLLFAEATRSLRARRVDWPLLLVMAAGLCGFAITLHFGMATQHALATSAGGKHPALSLPTAAKFIEALRTIGLLPALALLLPAGFAAWWTRRRGARQDNVAVHNSAPLREWVVVVALALTLCVVFLFTRLVTHYFWARYLLPGTLGAILLLAMACGAVGRRWVTFAAMLLGVALTLHERRAIAAEQKPWPQDAAVSPLLQMSDPSQPILIGSPILFDQIWWYSPPGLRPRVHYIADAQQAVKTDDFVGDLTLLAMHHAGSAMFPPDTLDDFLAQHPRFLFWRGYLDNGDWVQGYLRTHGYQFTAISSDASGQTLFQVSPPGGHSSCE